MIRSLLSKFGATATGHARRRSRQAGGLGRRRLMTRSAVAFAAVSLSLGVSAFSATAANAATLTVHGSVITGLSGVAHPSLVARDTFVQGVRWEHRDIWGAFGLDRHLAVSTGVIYSAYPYNRAAAMRSQVTVQRWNGSAWVTYERRMAYNGTVGDFYDGRSTRAWFFFR